MKRINKETLSKLGVALGVVVLFFIAGMAILGATRGNSMVLGCSPTSPMGQSCSATDPDGIIKLTAWNATTDKEVLKLEYHQGFAPIFVDFTIPLGDYIIELKDNEKSHEKDLWLVNSTGAWGPIAKKPKDP